DFYTALSRNTKADNEPQMNANERKYPALNANKVAPAGIPNPLALRGFRSTPRHPTPDTRYPNSPPFPTDVPIPPMPWKVKPDEGHVKGFVLTADLEAVEGVVTARGQGRTYTGRTDGTGCYALVGLRPGIYTLSITAFGHAAQQEKAAISA